MAEWHIFRAGADPHDGITRLPPPPPWRAFRTRTETGAAAHRVGPQEVELVNAALYLRRPLLVTGPPGVGKSTLALTVAAQLQLGPVLRWSINSRSTLADGLYQYDALARLRDANLRDRAATGATATEDVGQYIKLGPLGTALYPTERPRVLLIDEIDKSDIDLPNDLLHVFEEGEYEIPELTRLAGASAEVDAPVRVYPHDARSARDRVPVSGGRVRCATFPVVVLTSNGERELPPAFLRRCLRLDLAAPGPERLKEIVEAHLGTDRAAEAGDLIAAFVARRNEGQLLATDQLLNAVFMLAQPHAPTGADREALLKVILRELGSA